MSDMDATRALAILNRAAENQMYDPERIPEDDAAKVQAAVEQVQLAEQVEQVVLRAYPLYTDPEEWDKLSDSDKERARVDCEARRTRSVPHWPAVCSVLVEAKVFGGSGKPVSEESANQDPDPVQDPPAEEIATKQQAPEAVADQGDPANGEVWLDQLGNAWLVVHYGGGSSAEVKSVKSGEPTIVPAGFLKKKAPEEQQDLPAEHAVQASSDAELQQQMAKVEGQLKAAAVAAPLAINAGMPPLKSSSQLVESEAQEEYPAGKAEGSEQDRYEALVEEVQERYEPSGMPVPKDLVDPPSIDAESFADVDDATARILHGKYNALAARAKYLHDVEDAVARRCELVRTHHLRRAMGPARRDLGKDATVTEVKARAEEDALVVEWAEYVRQHTEEARAYKTFHDIYAQHVVVLSRDWSMREVQVR